MNSLYSQVNDNTPVLVGCSQYLDTKGPDGLNYLDILSVACEKAITDCSARISLNEHLDTIQLFDLSVIPQTGTQLLQLCGVIQTCHGAWVIL